MPAGRQSAGTDPLNGWVSARPNVALRYQGST